jgi:hypothetical protein
MVIVSSGQVQSISSGQVDRRDIVLSGRIIDVLSGGIASSTFASGAGSMRVTCEATAMIFCRSAQ